MNGLVTIRAYKKMDYFYVNYLVENSKSANVTFTYFTANRYLGLHFDASVLLVTLGAVILCMVLRSSIEPELLTFSLQNITDVCINFSMAMRMTAEL